MRKNATRQGGKSPAKRIAALFFVCVFMFTALPALALDTPADAQGTQAQELVPLEDSTVTNEGVEKEDPLPAQDNNGEDGGGQTQQPAAGGPQKAPGRGKKLNAGAGWLPG